MMNLSHAQSIEDVVASLGAMRLQEESKYRTDADLYQANPQILDTFHSKGPLHVAVDAECRFKMAQWCFQVVDFCKFNRETVAIAMSYLDRFLMNVHWGVLARQDRKVYQLVAMTCLYIAVKIHEPEAMEPQTISALSRGAYDTAQVEDMEKSILMALEWRMNPPTPQSFIHHFMALVEPNNEPQPIDTTSIVEVAKFQAELATNDPSLVGFKPSSIAFASVANATASPDLLSRIANDGQIDLVEASIAQQKLFLLMNGGKISTNGKKTSRIAVCPSPSCGQDLTRTTPRQYKAYTPVSSPEQSPRCVTMAGGR